MTDNLVEVTKLRKEFGGLVATNDIDFTIPRGSIVVADRPERGRQDDVLQPAHRRLQADVGHDPLRRRRRHRQAAARDHRARHRPHVPEHPPLPADDGARERARRDELPPARRHPRRDPAHALACGARRPTAREKARELLVYSGPAAAPRGAGRLAALRRPAPARGRPCARDRSEAAPARRADGGHEPAGDGRVHGLRPQGPRREGPHRPADRARHEGRDGRLRALHRARVRREDRRRARRPRCRRTSA